MTAPSKGGSRDEYLANRAVPHMSQSPYSTPKHTLAHRGSLVQAEGLPPHRNPLGQARPQLPLGRRARSPHRIQDLNESEPRYFLNIFVSASVRTGRSSQRTNRYSSVRDTLYRESKKKNGEVLFLS